MIAFGEKLSCRIFSAVLESHGIPAAYVPLDRCVDIVVDEAQLDQKFYDYLKYRAASLAASAALKTLPNTFVVPVVTGFIGHIPGGIIDAIGRGYTDFTAALIAAGLKTYPTDGFEWDHSPVPLSTSVLPPEEQTSFPVLGGPQPVAELQIWKEVDGIFTADPRKVPTAQLLSSIYPDEAAELTYYGSEVIHPFTMEQVIRAKVSIRYVPIELSNHILFVSHGRIKNTFKMDAKGTTILPEEDYEASTRIGHPQPSTSSNLITATACTLKTDVIVLNIHSNRKSVSHGFLAKIFSTLDRYGIVVDLISTSEVHVSLVISLSSLGLSDSQFLSTSDLEQQQQQQQSTTPVERVRSPMGYVQPTKLDLIMRELKPLGSISIIRNMVILSLVGKRMKNMVGIAGKMFSVLAREKVNIEMISQGASEVNISCVVLEADAAKALLAVHDSCVLGNL